MVPIISVVGASDSGKTTFLQKLLPELRRRGYRVGTVKHDAHGFEMDREGKDTWKHRKAGAQTIAISSPVQVASIRQTESEMDLEELVARYFWLEDLVLTEGYKRARFPKIEIFRAVVEPSPICGPRDNLVALVTDDVVQIEVPIFHFHEIERMADFLEDRYLKDRKTKRLMVQLDGKRLPMKDFVQDFIVGGILGMLSCLRGWRTPKKIDIHIRLEDE